MKIFIYKFSVILAISFFFTNIVFAQDSKEKPNEHKPDFTVFSLDDEDSVINVRKLIVYGKEDDGFPNEVKANGTIVEANVPEVLCGQIARAGTLKIKLDEKIEGYKDDYLYVIVLCLFSSKGNEQFVNKKIEIPAKKLTNYPYKYDVLLSNNFDTKGIPFYLSDDDGYRIKVRG